MTQPAIKVQGLSKEYIIGRHQKGQETFREMVAGAVTAPFRRLRKMHGSVAPEERFWALKDINFEVQPGEVVGIIGRNGAGKSTLLKILSRITEPTHGEVQIRGRVSSLLEVGTGFHPELTGRENIFLNGAILGMSRREIQKKFDEIVAFAEIEKFIDTPVKHYSSGMYVRLAFAVAAQLEPEILIVDEVLAVGDHAFQKKCLGKMGEVARQGRTVLFVSHNLQAIRSLCSRAIVMHQGRVESDGDVARCIDQYSALSNQNTLSEIQTGEVKRSSDLEGDVAARIVRVKLTPTKERKGLVSGRTFAIDMEIQVREVLTDIVFGWALFSADGFCTLECRSVDSYQPIRELKPGRYILRSHIADLPLNDGLYSVTVGMRNGSKTVDYLPNILHVRINAATRMSSLWYEATSGLLKLKSEWTTPQLIPVSDSGDA